MMVFPPNVHISGRKISFTIFGENVYMVNDIVFCLLSSPPTQSPVKQTVPGANSRQFFFSYTRGQLTTVNTYMGDELNKLIAFVQIPFCMFIYVCF